MRVIPPGRAQIVRFGPRFPFVLSRRDRAGQGMAGLFPRVPPRLGLGAQIGALAQRSKIAILYIRSDQQVDMLYFRHNCEVITKWNAIGLEAL